ASGRAAPPAGGGRGARAGPPPPPARWGAAIDGDGPTQPSQPGLGDAVPHDGSQYHNRSGIDLAAQEAQRRRGCPRAAAIDRAAEAEALVVLRSQATETQWEVTRLAGVFGRVQGAATRASQCALTIGKIAVESEQ